jgi:hypothetical protein
MVPVESSASADALPLWDGHEVAHDERSDGAHASTTAARKGGFQRTSMKLSSRPQRMLVALYPSRNDTRVVVELLAMQPCHLHDQPPECPPRPISAVSLAIYFCSALQLTQN